MPAGRPRQFDPEQVLDKAVEMIWREGPFARSLNELADALGLTKPALSRMFGGKDAFLAKVLERYYTQVFVPLSTELAKAATVHDVAQIYLNYYASALGSKIVGPHTGCLLAATTEATAGRDGVVADTTRDLNAKMRQTVVDALRRVGAEEPDAMGLYLYGQAVALAFLSRSGADGPTLQGFTERSLRGVGA